MTAIPVTATADLRRRNRRFLFGALFIAGFALAVIAGSGINKNLVYYWTPKDLYSAGDKAYVLALAANAVWRPQPNARTNSRR